MKAPLQGVTFKRARTHEVLVATRRKVYRIVLEPAEDTPSDWYVATSPNVPGLVTQGKGFDETIANVKDAISALFKGKPPSYTLEVKVLVPG